MDKHRDQTPEQIDRYWDARVTGGSSRLDGDAADLGGVIDALHAADRRSRPSSQFRDQLRASLMQATGSARPNAPRRAWISTDGASDTDDFTTRVSRMTVEDSPRALPGQTDRRWWVSHMMELAAMLVILIAAAAVVIYVTGWGIGEPSTQPGATGEETPEIAPAPDDSGLYRALTFEQAQQVTPFDLILPPAIPDGFELAGVIVNPPPVGDQYQATLVYRHTDLPARRFELWQMNSRITLSPSSAGAVAPGQNIPDPALQEIEIDGLPVTRMTRFDGQGDEMVVYVWHQDGLGLQLFAMTGIGEDSPGRDPADAVDVSDLEQFALAIIESRSSDDAPGAVAQDDSQDRSGPSGAVAPVQAPEPNDDEAVEMMTLSVYLVRDEQIGTARRSVPQTVQVATAAMHELLSGVNDLEAGTGLSSAIPPDTQLLGLTIQDGIAHVDLSHQFASGGGSLSMQLRAAQVVYTLTQFSTVDAVQFWVDGQAVEALGGEGLMLDRLVGRIDFEDVTPLIFVESPAPGDTISSPLHIWGTANTFEATFQIEILDSNGEVVYDWFIMATSGSGDRGTFEEHIDFDVTADGPGWVIVYQPSMEDGSRTHEVAILVQFESGQDEEGTE